MGIDRILLASKGLEPRARLDAFIVVADERLRADGRRLTSDLRGDGFRVDMTDRQRSVKAQFKAADRSGAAAAIVVGDEWESGNVTVKNLESGQQEEIPVKEIARWLQSP
jgi:histidyl-tRNA synthetase